MADEAKEHQHEDTRDTLVPDNAADQPPEPDQDAQAEAGDESAPEPDQDAQAEAGEELAHGPGEDEAHPGAEAQPLPEVLEVAEPVKPKRKRASKKRAAAPAGETEPPEEVPEEPEEEPPPPSVLQEVPDDGITRRWYAIHAHSGQEGSVKKMLLARAEQHNVLNLMTNVFVPMEEVAEIRGGEKKVSKRKYFPGYVLVQLPEHPERYPDLWHMIRQTPGVTGFIGSRTVPVPLEDAEVQAIVEEIRGERERPKPKVQFDKGERVKIIDGPFANFVGSIDEVNAERGTVKVMVEIFERLTSVEVEFWQVEHI